MSNSIYNISTWTANSNTYYKKYDIVKYGDYFYYCLQNHTSGAIGTAPAVNKDYWGGSGASPYDGSRKYEFLWKPSYQSTIEHEPKVRTIQFDDGYQQRMAQNIHNDMLGYQLSFENRNTDEITAISHFFNIHKGSTSFVWIVPPPYSIPKLFICTKWTVNHGFHDNITVSATFTETNN